MGYEIALGERSPIDVLCPAFTVFWKIGADYNFAPFVINYLLLITALFLIYRQTKSILVPQLIVICFLTPFLFLCYLFVWKDNTLISILFILVSLLLMYSNQEKKLDYLYRILLNMTIIFLFILAISLRVNAIFAVLPLLWFYTGFFTRNRLQKIIFFSVTSMILIGANYVIIYHVFHAIKSTYIQQLYVTDIAKINYKLNKTWDIPRAYLADTHPANVDSVFNKYNKYPNNDYFYFKYNETNAVFKIDHDFDALSLLKKKWLEEIQHHPWTYFVNRYQQWILSLNSIGNVYGENFKLMAYPFEKKHADKLFVEPKNALMSTIRDYYSPQILFYKIPIFIFRLLTPNIFFILNNILLIILIVSKRPVKNRQLIIYTLLSGITYITCYLPILPSPDYRYFTWVILTFWLSLGLWLVGRRT